MRREWLLVLFYTELKQTSFNSWYSTSETRVPQGENEHLPPLEIGTKIQNFIENLTSTAQFRLIGWLIALIIVYLPVWHSHCARPRFTVVVSYSGELAGRSFVCRGRLRSLRADCSTVDRYCVTIAWQQIF